MTRRLIEPKDLATLKAPGDPQLSPDGRWVAWVLQTPDVKEDRNRTDIWLARADGSEPARPLTTSGKDRHPRWSPDGETLAFVSERTGRPQLWLIRIDGGEAWQLQTTQAVTTPPAWAPDGGRLAFGAKVFSHGEDWVPYPGAPAGDRERAVAQAREEEHGARDGDKEKAGGSGADKDEKAADARVSDVKVVTRLKYRFDGIGYFGDRRSQLFVVPVTAPGDGGAPAARQITSGDHDHEQPAWTPDGRLVYVAVRREDADNRDGMDLWLADPGTGATEMLYEGDGPVSVPVPSPDGTAIAFLGHDCYACRSTTVSLYVLPFRPGGPALRQKDAVNLTGAADRPAGNPISSDVRYMSPPAPPQWTPDGKALYHLMGEGGHTAVIRVDCPVPGHGAAAGHAEPGKPTVVLGGPGRVISDISVAAGRLAYVAETPTQPGEVFSCAAGDPAATEARLSRANDSILAELDLAPVKRFTYAGADGWKIEGFLMLPPGAGKPPYPTVLFIHGGPHGVYGEAFQFQCQVTAAAGMAVLFTNPRGSQAYGQEFASAVAGDWGGKDYRDIMAGLDHIIARGVADPDRLGVTGWSYGGYMTSWTITQTNRFKAAVAGAIIYNRHNFWGTSDIGYNFGTWQFGGTPWENEAELIERSAVKHVANVTTPLLLLHGESDLRCPIEQTEQYFATIRYRGGTAVMVRYPGEYHGFQKPSHKEDRFGRMRAWFEYYLKK